MKTTILSFNELMDCLKYLSVKSPVYIDEVPEVLKDDFKKFIIGKTMGSSKDGRSEVYDMKAYYNKVLTKGVDYKIGYCRAPKEQLKNVPIKQLSNDIWIKSDRPFSDYPLGTKAKALGGGYWIKEKRGWRWCNGHCAYPTPGGDWSGMVSLPSTNNQQPTPSNVCN